MLLAIVIFAARLTLCYGFEISRDGCEADLSINAERFRASVTYEIGDAYPSDAHYDANGNLFYVRITNDTHRRFFDVHIIEPNTGVDVNVAGLPKGISYSIAINNKTNEVYFGTVEGLFTYDYTTHSAFHLHEYKNVMIKHSFVLVDRADSFTILQNRNEMDQYLLTGERKISFKGLGVINEIAIDNESNVFFIKENKLFVLKNNNKVPVLLSNVTYNSVAQIVIHKDGVFLASGNLTYYHENETRRLRLVNNAPGTATAMAFDGEGNFVLGVYGVLCQKKPELILLANIAIAGLTRGVHCTRVDFRRASSLHKFKRLPKCHLDSRFSLRGCSHPTY